MFRRGDLVKLAGFESTSPYRLVLKIVDDFAPGRGIRCLVLCPNGRIDSTGLYREDEIVARQEEQ